MSEYIFGAGRGHLPDGADEIARRHEARLINYTDPSHNCRCDWEHEHEGLPEDAVCEDCAANQRHWFATRDYGHPFVDAIRSAVLTELGDAGLIEGTGV